MPLQNRQPVPPLSPQNLWRNWDDIQCSYSSLNSIIGHWGQYTTVLKRWAGPGHWNDPDMLLIGNDCITDDEARTQMAIWCVRSGNVFGGKGSQSRISSARSIVAAPLIMGNDVRNVSNSTKAILLNPDAIAVDQDPMGEQGWGRGLGAFAQTRAHQSFAPPRSAPGEYD